MPHAREKRVAHSLKPGAACRTRRAARFKSGATAASWLRARWAEGKGGAQRGAAAPWLR